MPSGPKKRRALKKKEAQAKANYQNITATSPPNSRDDSPVKQNKADGVAAFISESKSILAPHVFHKEIEAEGLVHVAEADVVVQQANDLQKRRDILQLGSQQCVGASLVITHESRTADTFEDSAEEIEHVATLYPVTNDQEVDTLTEGSMCVHEVVEDDVSILEITDLSVRIDMDKKQVLNEDVADEVFTDMGIDDIEECPVLEETASVDEETAPSPPKTQDPVLKNADDNSPVKQNEAEGAFAFMSESKSILAPHVFDKEIEAEGLVHVAEADDVVEQDNDLQERRDIPEFGSQECEGASLVNSHERDNFKDSAEEIEDVATSYPVKNDQEDVTLMERSMDIPEEIEDDVSIEKISDLSVLSDKDEKQVLNEDVSDEVLTDLVIDDIEEFPALGKVEETANADEDTAPSPPKTQVSNKDVADELLTNLGCGTGEFLNEKFTLLEATNGDSNREKIEKLKEIKVMAIAGLQMADNLRTVHVSEADVFARFANEIQEGKGVLQFGSQENEGGSLLRFDDSTDFPGNDKIADTTKISTDELEDVMASNAVEKNQEVVTPIEVYENITETVEQAICFGQRMIAFVWGKEFEFAELLNKNKVSNKDVTDELSTNLGTGTGECVDETFSEPDATYGKTNREKVVKLEEIKKMAIAGLEMTDKLRELFHAVLNNLNVIPDA